MIVNVWGMTKDGKDRKWVVVTVDFSEIVKKPCNRTDYNDWTPMVNGRDCWLGEKYTYKVRGGLFVDDGFPRGEVVCCAFNVSMDDVSFAYLAPA